MPVIAEATTLADQWIYSMLTSDSELTALVGNRVYVDTVPEGVALVDSSGNPLAHVIYQMLSALDVRGMGYYRAVTQVVYLVRAVIQSASYMPIQPVAARIDELMQGHSGAGAGGLVLGWSRDMPFRMAEQPSGVSCRHLGGK